MKKILFIAIAALLFAACEKDNEETNYLTSVEKVQEGLIGEWENKTISDVAPHGFTFIDTESVIVSFYFGAVEAKYELSKRETGQGNDKRTTYHIQWSELGQGELFMSHRADITKLTTGELQLHEGEFNSDLAFIRK